MTKKDRTSRRQNPRYLKKRAKKVEREEAAKQASVNTSLTIVNSSLTDLDTRVDALEP